MRIAKVIIDIPARALDDAFDYLVPASMAGAEVGCCVRVEFGHRPAVGYISAISDAESDADLGKYKFIDEVLSAPYFDAASAECAHWIAHEYVAPLSEAFHLFSPPGGSPHLKKVEREDGAVGWELVTPGTGPVDDRWVALTEAGRGFVPPRAAVKQQAIVSALAEGEMRVAELAIEVGAVNASLKALEKRGIVRIEHRRRIRGASGALPQPSSIEKLTEGQEHAIACISAAVKRSDGSVLLCDGVTGSGKTEVYLRAIREVLESGGGAIVLVPEISLTPQTVGRFRSRFGDAVAVLHSRMADGERYDQWDLARCGAARVVVGARSALFAPVKNLKLIVIDEEHEGTYKQGSSPRYNARDVAAHMARQRGATLVLGSATPCMETLYNCSHNGWERLALPERATKRQLPPVKVVDMGAEFGSGQRSMFSRELSDALKETTESGHKAVLLLNKRGFASFLLCRECGFVPTCDNCSTSLTYHEKGPEGPVLMCHHCGAVHPAPVRCPRCGSPYLKRLGDGTERLHDELAALLGRDVDIVRMDADTTKAKGAHEKLLEQFAASEKAVLLGTQMIAKGLDFPEVTLVGVINADMTLNLPDFRAGERTWQLLEQVSGRAGRGDDPGRVIVQTYWPQHPAVQAAARHDRNLFLVPDSQTRKALLYPPFARIANILLWGEGRKAVAESAIELGNAVKAEVEAMGEGWQMLGPSPCVLAQLRGNWRWHILIKAPIGADIPEALAAPLKARKAAEGVSCAVDVDPCDLF